MVEFTTGIFGPCFAWTAIALSGSPFAKTAFQ